VSRMAPTYTNAHVLLRAGGHFGTNTGIYDNWSIGFRFGKPGSDVASSTDPQAFVTAAAAPLATFHAGANSLVGTGCFLDYVTGARVGTDGKYDPDTQETRRHDYPTTVSGSGSMTQGWAVAVVCSLRTARPRGYASNGRLYYPAGAATPSGSSGRLSQSQTNSLVLAWKTLIDSLNSAAGAQLGSGIKLCVFSGVAPGRTETVTQIRIDGRLDQQERRENKQPPVWSYQNIL